MIENARYKAWVKEIDSYRVAFNAFQERYHYLPGDFNRATTQFNVTSNFVVTNGNGNGVIDHVSAGGLTQEQVQAYLHLLAAGLIKGDIGDIPNNGIYLLIASAAGSGFFSGFASYLNPTSNNRKNWIMYHYFNAKFAQRYDEEFDDGKANSGDVVCWQGFNSCNGVNWPDESTTVSVFVAF